MGKIMLQNRCHVCSRIACHEKHSAKCCGLETVRVCATTWHTKKIRVYAWTLPKWNCFVTGSCMQGGRERTFGCKVQLRGQTSHGWPPKDEGWGPKGLESYRVLDCRFPGKKGWKWQSFSKPFGNRSVIPLMPSHAWPATASPQNAAALTAVARRWWSWMIEGSVLTLSTCFRFTAAGNWLAPWLAKNNQN